MKLSYRIISHISVALLILFAVWASLFYFIIIEEINDETDDSLEHYSEFIITRALAGESLPSTDNGSNNSYHITDITPEYAAQHLTMRYYEEMVYIESKKETEPALVLKTIFSDSNDKFYELTVSTPTIEKSDLQETILHWVVFLYIALLILIIVINIWILHRSFKPMYVLLNWLDNFRMEKEVTKLDDSTKITEFRKLNDAIIRTVRRNVETYEQQKLFTGQASHELQTPLAVCRNRLEMLSEDPELTEKQLGEILKTRQSIDHMIKLNKTLLLLTKIDNDQFPERKEIVVNDLIKKLLEDYSEVYAQLNVVISLQEDATLTVNMNETLASVLFGNLLKNAYVHNCENGSILIRITPAIIAISNTGMSEALDSVTIFDRFHQGTKKEGSTGLGLALSKSICKLYGVEICYDFSHKMHIFTLFF